VHRVSNCHHYLPVSPPPCHLSPGQQPAALSLPTVQKQIGGCGASPDAVKYLLKCFCFSHHPVNAAESPPMATPLPLANPFQPRSPLSGQGWQFALWDLLVVGIGGLAFLGKWTSEIWLALMHSRCDFFFSCAPKRTGSPSVELLG